MNKHKSRLNEFGLSVIELLFLGCAIMVIAMIGFLVASKNSSHQTSYKSKNYSSSTTPYDLPYTSSKTTIVTLPATNKIVTTVKNNDIELSFMPNNQVDDINAMSGSLTVNNVNGVVTKTITLDITEQLLTNTATNQGIDIAIGNQYSYDDSILPNGKLTHGPYQLKVIVSDTKGNQLYAYNSKVDF